MPIAALGILVGHELAYALTGTSTEPLHGYLDHVPQVVLVLIVLSFVGSAFVTSGTRLALWPFPAVAVTGFVAQEHLERLQHGGSLPFLLDRPVFLLGILVQCVVALFAWFVARVLLRVLHAQTPQTRRAPRWSSICARLDFALPSLNTFGAARPRAPPANA